MIPAEQARRAAIEARRGALENGRLQHALLFGSARNDADQDVHDHGLPWLRAGRD